VTIYPAASSDRGVRLVTGFMWTLAAVFAVGGVVVLLADTWVVGGVLLASALGTVAMAVYARGAQPVEYETVGGGITIRRRSGTGLRYEGEITATRRGKLGLRVGGNGGVYAYTGRYRAEKRFVTAYVTNLRSVVLLRVGAAELALSPADPDAFVREQGGGYA
jgi:hypothetical protein